MKRLQLQTESGWQWIFCYVVNTGKIATTPTRGKAIRDEGDNLSYFRSKTSAEVRASE